MERQNEINLKFLDIVKSENPKTLTHIVTLWNNFGQFVHAEAVPPLYKELKEMNVQYDELHDALRWLLNIGLLLRDIIGDTNEDFIEEV